MGVTCTAHQSNEYEFDTHCGSFLNNKFMLSLQSFKSRIVCLLIFEVNQDSLGDVMFFWANQSANTGHIRILHVRAFMLPHATFG